MKDSHQDLSVLVLAGGSGTRFWPASRRRRPKQFLPLMGERSLLRRTTDRVLPLCGSAGLWVCTTSDLGAAVEAELPELPSGRILREPQGRNTAPAIAWSLSRMPEEVRDGIIVVLPADHMVSDEGAFRAVLERATEVAAVSSKVLTLGVVPDHAETGYGYLELADEPADDLGARRVVRFTEKPELETAEAFVSRGRYLWNAGIFVFRGSVMLDHLRRLQPEITATLRAIDQEPDRLAEHYAAMPKVSIDHGVMEFLDDLATLPLDCGWTDLGSWDALAGVLARDEQGMVAQGDIVALDCSDSIVYSESGTVAVLGVSNLIVVRSGDVVLIVPRGRSQEVRRLVAKLREEGREDLL
jgi:mannose-1-phosphate guanylyltransferase/mannose-6-phosphate isomerase